MDTSLASLLWSLLEKVGLAFLATVQIIALPMFVANAAGTGLVVYLIGHRVTSSPSISGQEVTQDGRARGRPLTPVTRPPPSDTLSDTRRLYNSSVFISKEAKEMFKSMVRRLVRNPFSLVIVGVLVGVPLAGGAATLVSEEFRYQVQARVAGALPGTVIGGCEIKPYAQCRNANLSGANLSRTDLRYGNLSRANLSGADLSWAQLWKADLGRANLSGANLSGADVRRVDLTRANLSKADLRGADLTGADAMSADLSGANLTNTTLNGVDFTGAKFCNTLRPEGWVDNSGCP